MTWRPLLILPARYLVPLLLALVALLVVGANHYFAVQQLMLEAEHVERTRLSERLILEQSRLTHQMGDESLLLTRRLVAALALHSGITHAWLVDDGGRVVAGLSRLDVGRSLDQVLARQTPELRVAVLDAARHWQADIEIRRLAGALFAEVGIQPKHHLLVRLDLAPAVAGKLALDRGALLREAGMILAQAVLLGLLLHVLWFRRVAGLTRTAQALGRGDLDARTHLTGRDELAAIGAAIDRMAAEQQRRIEELQRLSSVIRHSPVVAVTWRNAPDWPVAYVSENIRRWGYQQMDFLNGTLNYVELIHPDDLERARGEMTEHLAHGPDDFLQEYRLRLADGSWIWLEDRTWLSRDATGAVTTIQGVLLDVSAKKWLHDQLVAGEVQYRLLFERNPAPMLIYDRESQALVAVNQAFESHYGYLRDEALTLRLPDLYPETEREAIATFARGLRGYAFAGEWHHCKKNGEAFAIEALSNDIEYAGRTCRIAVVTDISERKKAAEKLREQEEFFRLIADNVADFISVLDLQGRRLYNSPSYLRLFGDTRELRGSDSFAEIHPDDREQIQRIFRETVETGIGQAAEYRFVLASGETRYMESRGAVIRNAAGLSQRVVVVSRDVTERRASEAALRELNAELEERVAQRTAELETINQSLESFVYSVSHDLKSPLRGVEGYSRLLEADYAERLDEEGRLFISNIRTGVVRMNTLIDDLLAYSRMERRQLHAGSVDLAALVNLVLGERAGEIEARGVRVDTELAGLKVHGDFEGLALVLRNLLENALKFSRDAAEPHVEITATAVGARVALRFKDNGIGFDMKYHDRIFEIFQRLHRVEDYPGTGIGLAMVKKAVQRMGGRIRAESEPGQGATFHLDLPGEYANGQTN